MPRFTLVRDIDLRTDEDYIDSHLGRFGANSVITDELLREMGRNEVVFVRGRSPGRGRLVMNFMGLTGVMIVRVPPGAKYSVGLALRESLRRIARTKSMAKRLGEEAEEYRSKLKPKP